MRFRNPEVVELADGRVPGGEHLVVALLVGFADELGRLALGLGEHHVAPGPEVAAGRASAQRALERVAVGVHEARNAQRARHAGDASRGGVLFRRVLGGDPADDPERAHDRALRSDPGVRLALSRGRRRPGVGGRDLLRGCCAHRPARRLPRAPLACRVPVRPGRRPARGPAHDRHGGDPHARDGPDPARSPRSSSSGGTSSSCSATGSCRRAATTSR